MTQISKSDGTVEPFAPEKLVSSLKRAGAPEDIAEGITKDIEKELFNGITTGEIYSHAFARLRHERRTSAARYSLKRAVLEFGPSGFPFEAYVAELFRAEGAHAIIDQLVMGRCVEHEVDVVVRQKNKSGEEEMVYVEAKFHNAPGFKSDLKTALYVKARIDDIVEAHSGENKNIRGLIVTNTKFTSKAVQYAGCQELELLGWDYPHGSSLHERIDKAKLYPVTALTTLSRREKMALLSDKLVLCNALPKQTEALLRAGVSGKKATTVLEEVGALCVPGNDI